MACQYWYDGKWRTEEEFKNILSDGLLDKLISEGKINIPELEKQGSKSKKTPITLRILHKAQTNVNNARIPNTDNVGIPQYNPIEVISKAIQEGGKTFPFKMVIKVGGELRTGEGKVNQALKASLESNGEIDIKANLKEGVPYMLVPASYGWYPVQLQSHFVANTAFGKELPKLLSNLSKEKDAAKKHAIRTKIESNLYRTTIQAEGDKFIVTKYNPKTAKNERKTYGTIEQVVEAMGKQLLRVDYSKINSGKYNEKMAEMGAITTDLFSENGNFFNSSSFVLEAYALTPEVKDELRQILTVKLPDTAKVLPGSVAVNNTPVPTGASKSAESPIFETPIDKLTVPAADITREYNIPNSNKKAWVQASIIDGVLTITSIESFTRSTKKNAPDERTAIVPLKKGSREYQEITKEFFNDPKVVAFKDKLAVEKTATDVVENLTAPKSAVKSALEQMASESREDIVPDDVQSMAELLATSSVKVPEEPTEETMPDDGFDDFDYDVDRDTPNVKLRHTPKVDATTWNLEEEIQWMKDKLGKKAIPITTKGKKNKMLFKDLEQLEGVLPKEVYEMLLESRKHGKELHGVFTKAAVLLSENAAIGTGYHEAFHVVFNLALPLSVRIEILNEAYQKYKSEFPIKERVNSKGETIYELPTYVEIEEVLADKFMEMMVERNADKFRDKDFEASTLAKSMGTLYKTLRVFFNPERKINIEQLFEDINLGVYKHSIKFQSTVLPNSVRLRTENAPDRKYFNPLEEEHAFEYFETLMDELISQYKEKNGVPSLTDREVIQKIGVHKMYSMMLTNLRGEINSQKKKGKDELAANLLKFYNILTNNGIAAELVRVGEVPILVFKKSTDLLQRFNYNLQRRGIYIDYNNNKNPKVTGEESETMREFENEEEVWEEAWMRSHIEINPAESVSQRVKSFFATIPKYKSNRKNSAREVNSFGVTKKENPGAVFKRVIAEISNSYTMTDMMVKLDKMQDKYPFARDIIDRLAQDPVLKTELWAHVASKNYATFSSVVEKNGDYSVINSNRKTLDKVIQEELIMAFLSENNPIFQKPEKGKVDFEKINIEKAADFRYTVEAILTFSRQAGSLSRPEMEEILEDFSKTVREYNIQISKDNLIALWNPDSVVKKSSWNNVLTVMGTILNISKELEAGRNPFTSNIPEDGISRVASKKGRTLVETLGRQLEDVLNKEIVSSFRNIEGKTVYNLILSGYLNKQLDTLTNPEKFEKYLQKISGDVLLSNMPFIEDLQNTESDLQDELSVVLLDGLIREGKTDNVNYENMSDAELVTTSVGMFWNSGAAVGASKLSYFKLPIPSDSPTIAYIKAKTLQKQDIINKLVKVAEGEFLRIQKLKSDKDSPLHRVKSYGKNGISFQILPFLNGKINLDKNFNKAQVISEIEKFFDDTYSGGKFKGDFFNQEINYAKKTQVIKNVKDNGEFEFGSPVVSKEVKDRTSFFKLYLMNEYYYNTQFTTIFGGDPAFYKNTVDFQKRFKQVISPKLYTDTTEQPEFYKGIILKDSIKASEENFVKDILSRIEKADISESEKTTLRATWSTKWNESDKDNFDGNNESDGATYISMSRRRTILKGLGRWNPDMDAVYDRILNQEETLEDIMAFNSPFKPEKPFVYTQILVDGVMVPVQVKNAETVLIPSFANKKDGEGNLMYPELAALYEDFSKDPSEGGFDVAMFESAVKEGAMVNKSGEFSTYDLQPDGSYKLVADAEIIAIPSEDYGLQQETPPHFIDEKGNFGTQLRNLIIADINLEGDYIIGNQTLKGKDVAKLYQDIVVADLKAGFENVSEMFLNADGSVNYERLLSELRREIADRDLGQDYLDALAPITDALGRTTGTALPLYHPMISYKMEAVMNSFFKNRVTRQKINGGAFINTTSFGVSKYLKIKIDPETGGVIYEALLPAWSKQFFPKNSQGEVDIDAIKNNPETADILRIIGYRIPTEDKYSMFNIEVVGFTPMAMGGTAILPVEATTIAGLDFDIDKLYFMARAFKLNKKGEPQLIKYVEDISTPEKLEQIAKNIFSNFQSYKKLVKKHVTSEEAQERMLNGHRELLDKLAEIKREDTEEIKQSISKLKEQKKAALSMGHKSDSSLVKNIQDTIDDYYKALNDIIPFDDSTYEAAKAEEVLEFIKGKLESDFNALDFNTKQARDNKKLDIIQGILENAHTTPSVVNPGNFESLIEQASRIRLLQAGMVKEANLKGKALTAAAEKLDSKDFNINYPSVQAELFRRNMTGKQLIGVFANHNVHHAKAQFTSLRLAAPITFDGIQFQSLHEVKNFQGDRISRVLATDVAAVVDNAKNPVSSFINSNTFTADTIALLQRLGVPNNTIWAFLNQPVILEVTSTYFNDRGSLSQEKQFEAIKAKWKKILKEKALESDTEIDLTTELLEKNLVPGSEEFYQVQYEVLKQFETIKSIAGELSTIVQASKADTTGVGPSSAENYVMLEKQLLVLNKVEPKILGAAEVFFKGSPDQTMIPGFTKYGIHEPINILNKIFPSIGSIKDGKITWSMMGKLKQRVAREKGNKQLKDKEVRMVNIHFINFLASGFPFFSPKDSESIVTELPEKLKEFKNNMTSDAPYRMFVENLYIVAADKFNPLDRILYYKSGKTPTETQQIKNSWERMLMDTNPEVQQLALDLIKYTYHSAGYGFGPFNFAQLIPVKFWTDEYMLENGIVDKKGRTFNHFIKDGLSVETNNPLSAQTENRFLDQFVRNVAADTGLVPSVKIDKVLALEDEGSNELTLTTALVNLSKKTKGGVLRTTNGALVVNRVKNAHLFPDGTGADPVTYIKVYQESGGTEAEFFSGKKRVKEIQIYKYTPSENDIKDPNIYGNASDTATYLPVERLGVKNALLQYNLLEDIDKAPKVKAKSSIGISPSMEDFTMAAMADLEANQLDDLIAAASPTLAPKTTSAMSTEEGVSLEALQKKQAEDEKTTGANFLKANADTSEGLFESLAKDSWTEYVASGGTMSKEEFIYLSQAEQKTAIEQAKNC